MADRTTKFPNAIDSTIIKDGVEKTADYTVVIGGASNGDCGVTFYITGGSDVIFTMPSTSIGNSFTFVNMNDDGSAALTINPATLDNIPYRGSSTDDKDLVNTAATAKKGDFVKLASLNLGAGWMVVDASGIWVKEA